MRSAVIRKIGNLGRVVLPKELRNIEQLVEGTEMNIFLEDDGTILLQKSLTHCRLCGSSTQIHVLGDKPLCETCIQQIKKFKEV